MIDLVDLLAPFVGLLGVILGITMNEIVRRRNRREIFAQAIFEKRLDVYQGLHACVVTSNSLINKVIHEKMTSEDRLEVVSTAVHHVASYVDEHDFFLDDEIAMQSVALFMGTEELGPNSENNEPDILKAYRDSYKETLRKIKEDSGIAEVERLFKSVNSPKIESPAIDYYREQKRKASQVG